jgi:hypothetical protein
VNPRILGTELRRSGALPAGVVTLALCLVAGALISGPWRDGPGGWTREWIGLSTAIRYLETYLWPVALGAGAMQGLRASRSGMTRLLVTTSRPAWQRGVVSASALTTALLGAVLIPVTAGAVLLLSRDAYLHLAVLPTALVGLLALAAAGWLGLGAGRILPSPLTPPVLAIGAFLLGLPVWQSLGDVQEGVTPSWPARVFLLAPHLTGMPDAWTVLAPRVDLGQALWFTGLAGTGLVLFAARGWRRLLATVPAAVGLLAAQVLLPVQASRMYATDSAAARLVCAGNVCVTRLHQAQLAAIVTPAENALRRLRVLPNAPTRVEETTVVLTYFRARPRTAGTVPIWFDQNPFFAASAEDVERGLLAGAGVPSCLNASTVEDPPGRRETAARTVAAAWFLNELKPLPDGGGAEVDALALSAWNTLRRLPRATQLARIVALRDAGLRCTGDPLAILTTGRGASR